MKVVCEVMVSDTIEQAAKQTFRQPHKILKRQLIQLEGFVRLSCLYLLDITSTFSNSYFLLAGFPTGLPDCNLAARSRMYARSSSFTSGWVKPYSTLVLTYPNLLPTS